MEEGNGTDNSNVKLPSETDHERSDKTDVAKNHNANSSGLPPKVEEALSPQEEQVKRARSLLSNAVVSTDIIRANMKDLDGFFGKENEYQGGRGMDSVFLFQGLTHSLKSLPDSDKIALSDTLTIVEAKRLSDRLLAEINKRRGERGEAPAEAKHDGDQGGKVEPIISSIENVDIVELSEGIMDSTKDYPHEVPEAGFDANNLMWGRVNILNHDDMDFGLLKMFPNAVDAVRHTITTKRHLYKDGKFVGDWEQAVSYGKPMGRDDLPKMLGSYEEEVRDEERKSVENVVVSFGRNGSVYDILNIHYKKGEKSGATRLRFDYMADGSVSRVTRTEYDVADKVVNEEEIPYPVNKEVVSGESIQPITSDFKPSTDVTDEGTTGAVDLSLKKETERDIPEDQGGSGGILGRLSGFFGVGKKK